MDDYNGYYRNAITLGLMREVIKSIFVSLAPSFVNSFPHSEHVYFFFRETAVEYINCGKAIFSRVARVCAKDKGGPHKFRYVWWSLRKCWPSLIAIDELNWISMPHFIYRNHWTTFVKARLNCSIPGEFPFYFNEIQSTTNIVKGKLC